MIHDEFTHLKSEVSRQRIWQLRQHQENNCMICGKPAGKARQYCDKHYLWHCNYVGIRKPFKYINRRIKIL